MISSIFSDHNCVKLEIKQRKKNKKRMNRWRLNNMLVKNQLINEEVKEKIGKYLKGNENGNTRLQNLWEAIQAYFNE